MRDPMRDTLQRTPLLQTCFKAGCRFCDFALIIPNCNRPLISSAGLQVGSQVFSQYALVSIYAAGIPYGFAAFAYSDLACGLPDILPVTRQFPAEAGLYLIQS